MPPKKRLNESAIVNGKIYNKYNTTPVRAVEKANFTTLTPFAEFYIIYLVLLIQTEDARYV